MLAQQYLAAMRRIVGSLAEDVPEIARLADEIAGRIEAGGILFVYDNGHLLTSELFSRAGGLALLAPITLTRPHWGSGALRRGGEPTHPLVDGDEEELVLARLAVQHAGVRTGDVVLLGSVSGRSPLVVEMAREASRRGALTIALTALAHASGLPPASMRPAISSAKRAISGTSSARLPMMRRIAARYSCASMAFLLSLPRSGAMRETAPRGRTRGRCAPPAAGASQPAG